MTTVLPVVFAAGLVLLWVFGCVVFIGGEFILTRLPRFRKLQQLSIEVGSVVLPKAKFPESITIRNLSDRRVGELMARSTAITIRVGAENMRLGGAVTLAWYWPRAADDLMQELRMYLVFYGVLFPVGVLWNADQGLSTDVVELSRHVASFHTVPILEILLIMFIFLRVVVDTQKMKRLAKEL